jgi:RNA polymerase sigma factor (sigma-70 family)
MHPQRFTPPADTLELLERVARAVARSRRLAPADIDDFVQTVHVKMAERQYEPLRKFEGRSSLRTYLTVVLIRLLKDWQNHEYGKWRPSTAARRQGPVGTMLDRELNRDGHTTDEAVRLVVSRTGCSEGEAQRVADELPRRVARRRVEIDAALQHGAAFADPVAAHECVRSQENARGVLRDALKTLPEVEARLFVRRYIGERSVAALAKEGGLDQKALYRRFERIRRKLRDHVAAGGLEQIALTE